MTDWLGGLGLPGGAGGTPPPRAGGVAMRWAWTHRSELLADAHEQ